MRKPVFGVSDQVQHKPDCTATEDVLRLEISDLGSIRVAKTKALIRFAATAKLICVFVFAYAISRFSHDVAQYDRTWPTQIHVRLSESLIEKQVFVLFHHSTLESFPRKSITS